MSLKPILFKPEMVKAILDGRKTMTRRLVPEKIVDAYYDYDDWANSVGKPEGVSCSRYYEKDYFLERAKYEIGDVIWVRETFKITVNDYYIYKADEPQIHADKIDRAFGEWKPSIHMPYSACRLWLKVTDVKVERACDISEQGAIKEGARLINAGKGWGQGYTHSGTDILFGHAKESFKFLWASINGAETWGMWVWVYSFEVTTKPIY